ncbi:hypothetical protein QUA13_23445 [Microcoleus sp. S28C3]
MQATISARGRSHLSVPLALKLRKSRPQTDRIGFAGWCSTIGRFAIPF